MDTGTPASRSTKKNLTSIPAVKEQQLLEQVHVLLVLEQGAVQRRNELLRVVAAQRLRRDVLRHQELDPVQELGRGRLFLEAGRLADPEESRERLVQQFALQVRKMHLDDLRHGRRIGKSDVVKEATPEKGVGQLFFVVAGDHDDRPMLGAHRFPGLVNEELHAVEFAQQIVWKFDVGLVDL